MNSAQTYASLEHTPLKFVARIAYTGYIVAAFESRVHCKALIDALNHAKPGVYELTELVERDLAHEADMNELRKQQLADDAPMGDPDEYDEECFGDERYYVND